MRRILLMLTVLSTLLLANFSRSSAGVVTDSITGLHWQDNYNGGDIKQGSWEEAIDYCETLTLNGGGWRLPNIKELTSIVDYTRYAPSSMDPSFTRYNRFSPATSNAYWSSSTPINRVFSWCADFRYGVTLIYIKTDDIHYVRCVR